MAPSAARFFSTTDLERIKAAVGQAEKRTAGEIVPFVVGQSDEYESAEWRCGALFGLVAAIKFTFLHLFTSIWLPFDFAGAMAVIVVVFGVGMILAKFVPAMKRLFAGREAMHRRVHQRAAEAFVAEEVFNTRDRTGILLFVSLLERQVLVLGDSGINAKVAEGEWRDVVDTVIRGIRSGTPAEGFVTAIGKCGDLLQRSGVTVRPDDKDELPDSLRVEDR